ncbi:MAG: response regulator [Candidatus Tectimicrobiota bacterium]
MRGNEHILFVDDEEALVSLGRELFERLGYHVSGHTSSVSALAALRAAPQDFALVITDRTMPQIPGEALIRALRHIRPDIPVILCTGFSHPLTPEQVKSLGISAIIPKPVATRDWGLVIRRVLAQQHPPQT